MTGRFGANGNQAAQAMERIGIESFTWNHCTVQDQADHSIESLDIFNPSGTACVEYVQSVAVRLQWNHLVRGRSVNTEANENY